MRPIVICFIVLAVFPCEGMAQVSRGCELTEWVLQREPNTTRTPEFDLPFKDTFITVEGERKISLPVGFSINTFASVPGARGIAVSPTGIIYVTGAGKVTALPDRDRNGTADAAIVVANDLGGVHGIRFIDDELYVSTPGALFRLIDTNGDLIIDERHKILDLPEGGHHTRTFVYDSLSLKLYIQIGSDGNDQPNEDPERATIIECNLDGTERRIYARGLRNAVGMDLDPRTGALWVNNNGMDNLFGDYRHHDTPYEAIHIVCEDAHYGWPWAYGFRMRNPLHSSYPQSEIDKLHGPVAEVLAHTAPLGLHFYRGSNFPPQYKNAIFQAYHGSWNREPPAPAKVTVMFADITGQYARIADFVNGFTPGVPDSSNTNRWGRPVCVTEDHDGALLITDDDAGKVYRVRFTGSRTVEFDSTAPTISNVRYSFSRHGVFLYFLSNKEGYAEVNLYDVLGRRLGEIPPIYVYPGENVRLVQSALSAGYYLVVLTMDGVNYPAQFIFHKQ